jgi:uncharacterized protein YjiS (DUF1127 family)
VIRRTEPEAEGVQKFVSVARHERRRREGGADRDGSFIVQHALGGDNAPLNLTPLESPGEHGRSAGTGDAQVPGPPSRGTVILHYWLSWASVHRRAPDPDPLDDHTLSDIGLSRIETLY